MAEPGAAWTLAYFPDVVGDFRALGPDVVRRVRRAIVRRLTVAPQYYGKPLGGPLSGFRRLRVGDYRVVFRLHERTVEVALVAHRRQAYEAAVKRLVSSTYPQATRR